MEENHVSAPNFVLISVGEDIILPKKMENLMKAVSFAELPFSAVILERKN